MSKEKLVTIIVPVYNGEKYIRKCLDSLLSQTAEDYLIYCVNDGSTDASEEILLQYQRNYSDVITIFSKKMEVCQVLVIME